MGRRHRGFIFYCWCLMGMAGCKDKAQEPDAEAEAKSPAPSDVPAEPTLQVASGDEQDPGPVPPESDMAFFVVEGGLVPLGCFKQVDKSVSSGSDCLDLVSVGSEVRLGSGSSTSVFEVGERVAPLCMAGDSKKAALSVEGLGDGATFHFGAWPRSTYKAIQIVSEDTLQPGALALGEAEKAALLQAIGAAAKGSEDLQAHQVATVSVREGNPDRIFSVFVPDPRSSERYRYSGLFLAPGGDLGGLTLVEQSKSKEDVFETRGAVDLDGDGTRELWVRIVFAEGAGDRLVRVSGSKPEPLGPWTCGAG